MPRHISVNISVTGLLIVTLGLIVTPATTTATVTLVPLASGPNNPLTVVHAGDGSSSSSRKGRC